MRNWTTVVRGYPEIGGEREREPAARRRTLHTRHDRRREPLQADDRHMKVINQLPDRRGRDIAIALKQRDVAP